MFLPKEFYGLEHYQVSHLFFSPFECVISYLPMKDIASILCTCSEWEFKITNSQLLGEMVFKKELDSILKNSFGLKQTFYCLESDDENILEMIGEFYREPFISCHSELQEDWDFMEYIKNGGVTMNAIVEIHKFLLLMNTGRSDHYDESNEVKLAKIYFTNTSLLEGKGISLGRILLNMVNGWFKTMKGPITLEFQLQNSEMTRIIHYDKMDHKMQPLSVTKSYQASNDIFKRCGHPPYGLRNTSTLQSIRKKIYGTYNFIHALDWKDHVESSEHSQWSEFWEMGQEWWGCHAITTCAMTEDDELKFVIATASATD
ncbi:hypothetical protein C9374_002192 [Naegleria lovaniensis]|uniref:F-box domain-containing protein n=1 Tax=Naegleria lovaniensis TaxID=51637 RepID=A0AA88GUC0_NAELO|nr:uncharacterized protein C9374_002192 [Naegleria lovaniensis]KAG2386448.1 hypothetical protein C9374_002192 [Naegleria lovaniensis]